MAKYNLDKLKKVDLRDVWPHEALDFTKWLSEEPNLAMLSAAVGIELELIETESSVGSFNVDIYAQEDGTDEKPLTHRKVAQATPEFLKVFNPQKPSKNHWTTLRCDTSAYHIGLLIDTQRGRIGIEFYVPDDKEIGHKAIDNTNLFEERLGLAAIPFDAKKASGLRFYKDGCKIKNNEIAWLGFISEQLRWALTMKKLIAELGL